jgi:hypothetical protein
MTIDLNKLKDFLTPKNVAVGAGVLVVLGIFAVAVISVVFPRQAISQEVPAATALPPTATPIALPTPAPTLPPPQPAPVSHHYVSWTNREMGVYLRETPGSTLILDAIPNGEEVSNLGDQPITYGGVEWIEANYLGQSGWIATLYLYEIEGDYQRIGEDGKWLFQDMNGAVEMYLWAGTPYQVLQSATDDHDITWLEIMLPDGSSGWMKGR